MESLLWAVWLIRAGDALHTDRLVQAAHVLLYPFGQKVCGFIG